MDGFIQANDVVLVTKYIIHGAKPEADKIKKIFFIKRINGIIEEEIAGSDLNDNVVKEGGEIFKNRDAIVGKNPNESMMQGLQRNAFGPATSLNISGLSNGTQNPITSPVDS